MTPHQQAVFDLFQSLQDDYFAFMERLIAVFEEGHLQECWIMAHEGQSKATATLQAIAGIQRFTPLLAEEEKDRLKPDLIARMHRHRALTEEVGAILGTLRLAGYVDGAQA